MICLFYCFHCHYVHKSINIIHNFFTERSPPEKMSMLLLVHIEGGRLSGNICSTNLLIIKSMDRECMPLFPIDNNKVVFLYFTKVYTPFPIGCIFLLIRKLALSLKMT